MTLKYKETLKDDYEFGTDLKLVSGEERGMERNTT
jgi:hypothetical protein